MREICDMPQHVLVNLETRLKPIESKVETLLDLSLLPTREVFGCQALHECIEARLRKVVRTAVVVDAVLDVRTSAGREINLKTGLIK